MSRWLIKANTANLAEENLTEESIRKNFKFQLPRMQTFDYSNLHTQETKDVSNLKIRMKRVELEELGIRKLSSAQKKHKENQLDLFVKDS